MRRTNDALEAWPGVCPHEGAVLSGKDLHGSTVKCSWHGLEYGPRHLKAGDPAITMCGARLSVADGMLSIVALPKAPL